MICKLKSHREEEEATRVFNQKGEITKERENEVTSLETQI
jgi:hypothetical protein